MHSNESPILGVPTNIVTGFLGVGKTSAILNLMKNKPNNERWAILVNEFGEIGIDGSLMGGQHSEERKVFIREVPGGCMCCSAGLPMQIALNQLLTEAKPDRLLIEPTGLGHPKEVLQVLSSEHYRKVLKLQKTITLVDARKLSESRYSEHETFVQQIAIADRVVGNKVDLYHEGDESLLLSYVGKYARPDTAVSFAQYGDIPFELFEGETVMYEQHEHHHYHHQRKPLASELPLPESGVMKASNKGEGFHSIGWRFAVDKVFERAKLVPMLLAIQAERIKGVFITQDGVFGYNLTLDGLTEVELDDCSESRVEVISERKIVGLERELLQCLVD